MEDDRRIYPSGRQLAAHQAEVATHFGKMVHHRIQIQGWLQDGREIVLEWLEAAARARFQTTTVAALWQPINEGAGWLSGLCPRESESKFVGELKVAATTLRWLRVHIETDVSQDFPPRVLAAIAALELIDRTLVTFSTGRHDEAEKMFAQIDLSFLKESTQEPAPKG